MKGLLQWRTRGFPDASQQLLFSYYRSSFILVILKEEIGVQPLLFNDPPDGHIVT